MILLSWPRLVICPIVGIGQEAGINLPLLEAEFLTLNCYDIVDCVPSVDDQMVRARIIRPCGHVFIKLLLLLLFLLRVLGGRRYLSSLLF